MASHCATSIDQPYEYEDLNLERPALRLVRLLSGDGPELKCELFQAHLDERETVLPYEAVSYTWDCINLIHSIDVDGKRLGVTASLYVALRNLRYLDKDRIIWIDGICINQSNYKERGHQVQQMGYIYRHAERVIFWMGLSTYEIDELMDSLRRLTETSIRHTTASWELQDPRWHYLWIASQPVSRRLADSASVLRQGLADLLARPWFTRAWILQEVANAQSALICCSQKSVSARLFPLMPVLLGVTPQKLQQAVLDIMPGPSRKATWWAQNRSMYYLLKQFGSSSATEPRDIIYALRGISTDACDSSILTPNYGRSNYDILKQVWQFLFYCTVDETAVSAHDIRGFAAQVSSLNNNAIGECIRASKKEELSILLEREDVYISDYLVRCALKNTQNGLQLLQHVIEHGEHTLGSRLAFSNEAVLSLARRGDASTMSRVLHHWTAVDESIMKKFLLSAVLNTVHAPEMVVLFQEMFHDHQFFKRGIYLDKYVWLATLLNTRTGYKTRDVIFQKAPRGKDWNISASAAYNELADWSYGAYDLIKRHLDMMEIPRDKTKRPTLYFKKATLVSFKKQIEQYK